MCVCQTSREREKENEEKKKRGREKERRYVSICFYRYGLRLLVSYSPFLGYTLMRNSCSLRSFEILSGNFYKKE